MGGFLPPPAQPASAGFPYNALMLRFGNAGNLITATSSDNNVTSATVVVANTGSGSFQITWTAGLFQNYFFYMVLPQDNVLNIGTSSNATDQGSFDGNITFDTFVNNVSTARGCYVIILGK